MSMEAGDYVFYEANELNQYSDITGSEDEADFSITPVFDADGNQTMIKTATGIWHAVYNAENRPVSFTNEATGTVVTCAYDSMGRRSFKQVTVNGTVTLHQRYLYRGYLQIACIDLTRSHHAGLWLITWDPTQPIASRPLVIQISGTWYTYGWDRTKNIYELYGTTGYIATDYTYSPYGAVTSSGNVTQPIQWSSEYHDTELGLVYYNYRHYNPLEGMWLGRDPVLNYNLYKIKHILSENDILGLIIKTKCDIEKFLKEEYGIESKGIRQKGAFLYKQYTTAGEEIVEKMILSSTIFLVKGRNVKMITENLEKHVNTRKNVISVAKKYNIEFPDNNEDNVDNLVSRLKNAKDYETRLKKFNKINESGKAVLTCYGATYLIMSTASNPKKSLLERTFENIHIPGDWLYIDNTSPNEEPFYEGENLIYLGKGQYWGTVGTPKIMSFQRWFDMVKSWNGQASSHGTTMRFPHEGISLEK